MFIEYLSAMLTGDIGVSANRIHRFTVWHSQKMLRYLLISTRTKWFGRSLGFVLSLNGTEDEVETI